MNIDEGGTANVSDVVTEVEAEPEYIAYLQSLSARAATGAAVDGAAGAAEPKTAEMPTRGMND